MADNIDVNVNVNTTQAQRNLQNLDKQVTGLGDSFGKLRNLVAGIAFTNIIRSSLQLADSIDDVSKATGLATTTVIGFGQAIAQNGGTIAEAQTALTRLSQTISEAQNGNQNAITSFNELGISISDIATLSDEQILQKVIAGLGQIKDKGDQARIATDLLGKSVKGIDFTGVSQDIGTAIQNSTRYAESNKSAADAAQNLQNIQAKLTQELLLTLQPISDLVKSIDANSESFQKWTNAIRNAVLTLGFILGVAYPVVRAIAALRLAWLELGAAVGTASVKFKDVFLGLFSKEKTLANLKKMEEAIKKVLGPDATKDVEKYNEVVGRVGNAYKYLEDKAKALLGVLLSIAGVGGSAAVGFFGDIEEEAKRSRTAGRPGGGRGVPNTDQQIADFQKLQKAYTDGKAKVDSLTSSIQDEFDSIAENFNIQKDAITLGEKLAAVKAVEKQVTDQAAEARKRYNDMKQGLDPKNENDKKLIDYINGQIAALNRKEKAAKDAGVTALQNLQAEKDKYIELTRTIEEFKRKTENEEYLQGLRNEVELIGLSGEELQKTTDQFKIYADLRKKLNDLQAEENTLTANYNNLTEEGRAAEKQAYENSLADIQKRRVEVSQAAADEITINQDKWAKIRNIANDALDGFMDKLKNMRESLTPYSLGETLFAGLNNAIDEFVKTGKFKFKEFALNAIREWAAMKAKLALLDVFDGIAQSLKNILKEKVVGGILGKIFGSIFGFAEGGSPPVNKPSIVGEKGPELFVPKSAGTIVPNDKLTAGGISGAVTNNYITNNINALDAKSVAQLFAENRKTLLGVTETARREMAYGR